MEGADGSNHSKRSFRRSSNNHISLSDTESMTSQFDSWHSPLRSESPLRSDDLTFRLENDDPSEKNDKAIVLVDKYYSLVPSLGKSSVLASSLVIGAKALRQWSRIGESRYSDEHSAESWGGGRESARSGGETRDPQFSLLRR
ncbi:hypothetical protein C2S51_036097 [Perilla frutescens var. frutescens]|nr:hypothetical protein C2S51_036097 [Perilla frutescens var. frutescens]